MKRRMKFETGMDISVTIEVDLDVLTADTATQICKFWTGGDEVIEASDGDVIVGAARYAASSLMRYLIDNYTPSGAVRQLCEDEGWPDTDHLGMKIVDHEIPDFDPAYLELEEVPV